MNLADKINILMKQNNIKNPKELSEKLNKKNLKIPYTTLLTIINNEVQDIKLGTARKLCKFFDLTLDQLLDDDIELTNSQCANIEPNIFSDDNAISESKNNPNQQQSFNHTFDIEGLDEKDIEEVHRFVEFIKNKKMNKNN